MSNLILEFNSGTRMFSLVINIRLVGLNANDMIYKYISFVKSLSCVVSETIG